MTAGAEEQEAGLWALQGHLDTVRRLLASSTAILQSAANMFPDACDAAFHWVPEMDPPSAEASTACLLCIYNRAACYVSLLLGIWCNLARSVCRRRASRTLQLSQSRQCS